VDTQLNSARPQEFPADRYQDYPRHLCLFPPNSATARRSTDETRCGIGFRA
jgi:hypothetical protein